MAVHKATHVSMTADTVPRAREILHRILMALPPGALVTAWWDA